MTMSGEVARLEFGVERAWAELQRHLSWATGFLVLYVFVPTAGQAAALGDRVQGWADQSRFVRRVAEDGARLREFARGVDPLLGDPSRATDTLLWIEAPRVDDCEVGGPWAELLARLNERREQMRVNLGGVVIVAPVAGRGRFAALGPDLWSIRASSIELPAPAVESTTSSTERDRPRADAAEVEAAEAILESLSTKSLEGLETHEQVVVTTKRVHARVRLARATRSRHELELAFTEWCQFISIRLLDLSRSDLARRARLELLRVGLDLASLAEELGANDLPSQIQQYAEVGLFLPVTTSLDPAELMFSVELDLHMGRSELNRQRWVAADKLFIEAQTKLDSLMGSAPSPHATHLALGRARALRGQLAFDGAEEHYRRAIELEAGVVAMRELGETLLQAGDPTRALDHLREALELADRAPGPEQVHARRSLASALQRGGRLDEARDLLEQARDLATPESALLASCLDDLSALLRALGEELDARRALGRALLVRQAALGPRHALTRETATRLEAMAAKSLVILHLSDLHFGPHSRFADLQPRAVAELFARAVERVRKEAGLATIDLIVVSGDIVESGHKKQFEAARRFFEVLGGELGLRRDRFVFAPGNHDFSWPHIRRERENQEIDDFDDDELCQRIAAQKFANFTDFIDAFYGEFAGDLRRHALVPTGWVHEFPELRVSVGVLDSSEDETDLESGGGVSSGQAQSLLSHWTDAAPWLRVLVVHHNPRADFVDGVTSWKDWLKQQDQLSGETIDHFVADTIGFDGKERLERIARDARVQVLLHGHVHSSGAVLWPWGHSPGSTPVLAAGSCGLVDAKLPGDQPAMFQLLGLDLEGEKLDIHRLRYEPRAREEGRVELGTFVTDAELAGGHEVVRLSLPAAFALDDPAPEPAPTAASSFWKEYQTRLRDRFVAWELGAMQRGARQLAAPRLDEMYVPLRLADGYDNETFALGEPIGPEQLLARERNIIVRGTPGSGKTTWLRWIFRRLIERSDVLPVLVELRRLAHRWSRPDAEVAESFDTYLFAWVEAEVGAGWDDDFRAALRSETGPRPVLLLDGWDELGDLGRDFRAKLDGFVAAHPRVLVVASSRPYGVDVPQEDKRYEELQLQPMSDDEVARFVHNVYRRVHRVEGSSVDRETARFRGSLAHNKQARALGRTPLLLVMLLMVGRDAPLPDQRSELYRVCLENLLDTRPRQRQAEGVLRGSAQWAPERYLDRRSAAAGLAPFMQTQHLARTSDVDAHQAIAARRELERELPESWEPHQRAGFLRWLVSGAGVMNEHDDDTLSFAHLGFQEYLAAWQIDVDHDDLSGRVEVITRLGAQLGWWETLRLWAALVEDRARANLESVVRATLADLDERDARYWWLGTVFADGLCAQGFDAWLDMLGRRLDGSSAADACADAWRDSQQLDRRERVIEALGYDPGAWTWLDWRRATLWSNHAGLGDLDVDEDELPPAQRDVIRVVDEDHQDLLTEAEVARGRVALCTSPSWSPGSHPSLLGLRLWPTRRIRIGWEAQVAASLGAPASKLPSGNPFSPRYRSTEQLRMIAKWLSTFGRAEFSQRLRLAADIMFHTPDSFSWNLNALLTPMAGFYRPEDWVGSFFPFTVPRIIEPRSPAPAWQADLATTRFYSSGLAGTRVVLAYYCTDTDPLVALLRTACQLSLDPTADPAPLHAQITTFTGHPLWPALARHIARVSTPEDRAYLEELARNPDQVEDDVLRWGLKYWVRGDIMLNDDTVLTLDEIWAEQGRDPLPYLEDMPSERDIDWDELLAEDPADAPV